MPTVFATKLGYLGPWVGKTARWTMRHTLAVDAAKVFGGLTVSTLLPYVL